MRPARRRVLKILLPPVGRHVEQRTGIGEGFGAARVGRIGVKDLVADAEENTEAVLFSHNNVGDLVGFQLGLVSIIVFDRRNLLVVGDVKVVIEVAAERGNPREAPSLSLLVGLELGKRRAGHHDERGVAFVQHAEITDGVRISRAARAAFLP